MNDQARKLALLGLTDVEIGEFFGVDERTINRWKEDFPAFCQSLNDGKVAADANVAESLYKRARGVFVEFQKAYKGDDGAVEVITLKTWQPGDPGAAKLWLTNRQPKRWRDKRGVEHAGQVDVTYRAVILPEKRVAEFQVRPINVHAEDAG